MIMNNISLRSPTMVDLEFLYALHSASMKSYVERAWAWDEQWQVRYFREHIDASTRQVTQFDGQDIGFIDVEEREDHFLLANIEISPDFQRRGIGTFLIHGLLRKAAATGLPVILQVVKVNPAPGLNEWLGSKLTDETGTHYLMKFNEPPERVLS